MQGHLGGQSYVNLGGRAPANEYINTGGTGDCVNSNPDTHNYTNAPIPSNLHLNGNAIIHLGFSFTLCYTMAERAS